MARLERVTRIGIDPDDDLLITETGGVGVTLHAHAPGEEVRIALRACPQHVAQLEAAAVALRNIYAAANETEQEKNNDDGE